VQVPARNRRQMEGQEQAAAKCPVLWQGVLAGGGGGRRGAPGVPHSGVTRIDVSPARSFKEVPVPKEQGAAGPQ